MSAAPRRVLQVVRAMDRGGVETWLMHVLRRIDPYVLHMDFLVHTEEPADYDREIAARGARLIRCPVSWRSPGYGSAVRSLLRRFGPYDAVHSHIHYFSGFLLAIAHSLDVPVRIAHSHSDTSWRDSCAHWPRRQYLRLARTRIGRHATHWLAASQTAGSALFGDQWGVDGRSRVLHCGINLEPFRRLKMREEVRKRLQIADDEIVVGHVGRLDSPKNHAFLLEAAAEAARRIPRLRLVLVGEGPARPGVEQRVQALGMAGRTLLLGNRTDVPELLSAMDVFVFPSLWEGLPLTVVEAQAAGLPCLISNVISPETVVAKELVQRLSLNAGPGVWGQRLAEAVRDLRGGRGDSRASLEETDFNVERSLETLYALYAA